MGEDAPTGVAVTAVIEPSTAWSLDEGDDSEEWDPPRGFTPGRITGTAVAVSIVTILAAAVITVWQLHTPETKVAGPATTTVVVPAPQIEAAPPPTFDVPAAKTLEPPPPSVLPELPTRAAYDQLFITRMEAIGEITDPEAMLSAAHKVCDMFRAGEPMSLVQQKLANALHGDGRGAYQFASTVQNTYPDCP